MVEAAASVIAVEAYRDGRNLISYVTKKFDYADDLDMNYKRLKEESDRLFARREDIEAQVQRDKTKKMSKECEAWFYRVKVIEQEVMKLENEFNKGKKRTWRKRYILSRSNLSRRMVKMCEELHSLWVDARVETEVAVEKPPEPVRLINGPKIENKSSLHLAIAEVRGHLRDRDVKRVGVWGMYGIGKTTILQNLNDDEEIGKMFDIVIYVCASKDNCIETLQCAISRRLKLHVEGNDDAARSCWPVDMEVDEFINVKRLSEDDAWKMFREKVGRNINLPGVEPIARLVVNECAGLPLLIDRVARNFRKKDNIYLWRDGLRSLRRWPNVKIHGMDEVLEFLRFFYDDLDDGTKNCFLYGALYPEDYDIFVDYLLECWKARGFMGDVIDFIEARERGHSILRDLIDVSLLERSERMKYVRMNKVIRNMALKISSESKFSTFLVQAQSGEGLHKPPKEDEWKGVTEISLIDNKLHSLPEKVECEGLRTLLLQKNHDLTLIPESFFRSMQKLQVLDLYGSGIKSLPSSISSLTNLTALYLNSCSDLMELPADMRSLINLEILDIRGTGLSYLPVQIGHLLHLRCLRISLSKSCMGSLLEQSKLAQISQNVISGLSLLEELVIDVDPHNLWWDGVVKAVTEQVATLTKLTSLSFCFPSIDCLKIFVTSSSLWKDFSFTFRFSVGYHESTAYKILEHFEYEIFRCLRYVNGEGVNHVISEVLAEAEVFELIHHKGISSITEFGMDSINKMRGCLIEGCTDIVSIINGAHTVEASLGCLEKMVIKNAPRLLSIFSGPLHSGSLARLTTLSIYNCPKLLKIFSSGVVQQLSELQQLRVEECQEIREIIVGVENIGLETGCLPKLKMLILENLPKLRSIWVDDSLEWPSLEGVTVYMCHSLIRLPFGKSNAINLKYIKGQIAWWRKLEWAEDGTRERLQKIFFIFNQ
ncbi:hypothetical protein SAY86_023854 [Trapa natans]|uniref:NB-ARC domain-containing protein n=1 Tax=Trapa natans TaxID=22666 RepID=A0AAN7LWG6_TRANT|nr:hypothetical protein SAY86_023854 [Trapa natans]